MDRTKIAFNRVYLPALLNGQAGGEITFFFGSLVQREIDLLSRPDYGGSSWHPHLGPSSFGGRVDS